jgi:hypothetical protein
MGRRSLHTVLLLCCLALSSAGQKTHKRPEQVNDNASVPDARSFTELFDKLELKLEQAVREKSENSLDALLAPEFSFRSARNPETLLSRASWIEKTLASHDDRGLSHAALTIRAFKGVAVVSFVSRQKLFNSKKGPSSSYLIIDVWEATQDRWQVGARYAAPTGVYPDRQNGKDR